MNRDPQPSERPNWTQEELECGGLEVEKAYLDTLMKPLPYGQDWPAERVKRVAIEIACQRNALLEAIDDLLAAIPNQTGDRDWWQDDLIHAVTASHLAISKATRGAA